jgi:transcriptional regulator with XRE-family HTH domain
MPGRAADLIAIPDSLWQRAEMIEALGLRDIGRVFQLLRQYAGASQTRLAIACDMTQPKVSGIMRGTARVEALEVFERIAAGLGMPDSARFALGLAPKAHPAASDLTAIGQVVTGQIQGSDRAIPSRDTGRGLDDPAACALLSPGPGPGDDEEDEARVQRRTFVGLTSAALFGAVLADTAPGASAYGVESLATALATYAPDTASPAIGTPADIRLLAADVAQAKRGYQACRYAEVTRDLPALLARLQDACAALGGQVLLDARTLSAEAHHVAASILLKRGEQGLGWLAADRSMQAARASDDPVTIASSARIITHAMTSSGHLKAAAATASTHAARLDRVVASHDPESLSVYGALLLRGAIAAARHDDRRTAHELLGEADDAGSRVGGDQNLRWTAFGPANTRLHRVHIAVTLGDAGTALDVARTIDLSKITVTERKASFLVDAARAFLQYGKHEKSLLALRAAEQTAPEEIAGRPAVQGLLRDLVRSAPPSVQRQAAEFGDLIGVSR